MNPRWSISGNCFCSESLPAGLADRIFAAASEVLVPVEAKLKVGKAKLFAITVERPGGVVVSKRERIVLTATPPPG